MSIHPSLRSKQKSKQHRSVLKRYERIKELKKKEKWMEGDSVFGLLKLKILRFKLKKEKAAPVAEGVEAASAELQTRGAEEGKTAAAKETERKESAKKEEKKK